MTGRSQFFVTETGSQIKYSILHISIIYLFIKKTLKHKVVLKLKMHTVKFDEKKLNKYFYKKYLILNCKNFCLILDSMLLNLSLNYKFRNLFTF